MRSDDFLVAPSARIRVGGSANDVKESAPCIVEHLGSNRLSVIRTFYLQIKGCILLTYPILDNMRSPLSHAHHD